MGKSRFLMKKLSFHKKTIAIESRIERTVEDEGRSGDADWRTKLEPTVSVSIRRGSDVIVDGKRSTSVDDPLNWPTWKREVAFTSLILLTSTASSLKLVLAPLNAVLSSEFDISYLKAAALTGVPIILGAFFMLAGAVSARVVSRRMIMVIGALLLFIGSIWNMKIHSNYGQFMAARVFQGVGWGLVDSVVGEAVEDLLCDRRRKFRRNIFDLTTSFHLWFAPVSAGYWYQKRSWRAVFFFISLSQMISLLLLVFATPETQFHPVEEVEMDQLDASNNVVIADSAMPKTSTLITTSAVQGESSLRIYFRSLKFPTPQRPWAPALPAKALLAPSTALNALLNAPLTASAYGLASSLALIFSVEPTFLLPQRIGLLFVLPACFTLVAHSTNTCIDIWRQRITALAFRRPRTVSIAVIAQLLLLGAAGIAGFGIYTCNKLGPRMIMSSQVAAIVEGDMMNESRLWIVGALFGAAVAATVGTQSFTRFKLQSAHAVDAKLSGYEKNCLEDSHNVSGLIESASRVYVNLLAGIFALAFPIWSAEGHAVPVTTPSDPVPFQSSPGGPWKRHDEPQASPMQMDMEMFAGIQITVVALALVTLVVSGLAALVVIFSQESLRRKDRKVLGLRLDNGEVEEFEMR